MVTLHNGVVFLYFVLCFDYDDWWDNTQSFQLHNNINFRVIIVRSDFSWLYRSLYLNGNRVCNDNTNTTVIYSFVQKCRFSDDLYITLAMYADIDSTKWSRELLRQWIDLSSGLLISLNDVDQYDFLFDLFRLYTNIISSVGI